MMNHYRNNRLAKQSKVHERLDKLGLGKKYKADEFVMLVKWWFICTYLGISSESTKEMSLDEMQAFLDITDGFDNYEHVLEVLEEEAFMSLDEIRRFVNSDLKRKEKEKKLKVLKKPLTDRQYWEVAECPICGEDIWRKQ